MIESLLSGRELSVSVAPATTIIVSRLAARPDKGLFSFPPRPATPGASLDPKQIYLTGIHSGEGRGGSKQTCEVPFGRLPTRGTNQPRSLGWQRGRWRDVIGSTLTNSLCLTGCPGRPGPAFGHRMPAFCRKAVALTVVGVEDFHSLRVAGTAPVNPRFDGTDHRLGLTAQNRLT